MSSWEWVALLVLAWFVGWSLNKIVKPRTLFERRMIGLLGMVIVFFIIGGIYTVADFLSK